MPYLNYATAVREGRLAEYEAQRVVSRGAYEERRATRVEALKKELIRDDFLDPRQLDNVPYYHNVEEQNLFLDSITNGQTFGSSEYNYWSDLEPLMYFGQTMKRKQHQFNTAGMIPLILPKFSDLNNISVKEQQFLAMQGLGVGKDVNGRYALGGGGGSKANFQLIIDTGGKMGEYYRIVEPSEYYISQGLVPQEFLREIEVHGAVSGTGFKRGRGYVGDEPEVTTDYIQPQVVVEKPFEKPERERVFGPEPEITTDHIEPPVEEVVVEKPFDKPERERVFGPEPEPEITTDHIEPPSEEQDFLPPTSQVDPPIEDLYQQEQEYVTTSQVDPPGVEEPCPDWVRNHPELSCPTEVTTDRVDPPPLVEEIIDVYPQEVTAQISWFGNTWFPWHLELEDRRRR